VNPLSGARMDNLFSTHPDVENRIAQLNEIAQSMDQTRAPQVRGAREAGPWG
jgi:heat shock protein HtpX